MLAILENLHTVHNNVFHSHGVLMRFFEGGMISDRRWIEHNQVSKHAFLEQSPVIEP